MKSYIDALKENMTNKRDNNKNNGVSIINKNSDNKNLIVNEEDEIICDNKNNDNKNNDNKNLIIKQNIDKLLSDFNMRDKQITELFPNEIIYFVSFGNYGLFIYPKFILEDYNVTPIKFEISRHFKYDDKIQLILSRSNKHLLKFIKDIITIKNNIRKLMSTFFKILVEKNVEETDKENADFLKKYLRVNDEKKNYGFTLKLSKQDFKNNVECWYIYEYIKKKCKFGTMDDKDILTYSEEYIDQKIYEYIKKNYKNTSSLTSYRDATEYKNYCITSVHREALICDAISFIENNGAEEFTIDNDKIKYLKMIKYLSN